MAMGVVVASEYEILKMLEGPSTTTVREFGGGYQIQAIVRGRVVRRRFDQPTLFIYGEGWVPIRSVWMRANMSESLRAHFSRRRDEIRAAHYEEMWRQIVPHLDVLPPPLVGMVRGYLW